MILLIGEIMDIKYILFWIKASFIAPFHFRPSVCHVPDPSKCRIWNCKWHYEDGKYCDCVFHRAK